MSKGRPPSGSRGGSRFLSYVLIVILGFFVVYYVVLPAFAPRSSGPTGPTGSVPTISLNPSTDISGSSVVVTGQNLPPHQNVTVSFGSTGLKSYNSTTGSSGCKTSSSGILTGCTFWVPNAPSGAYKVALSAGTTGAQATFSIPRYTPPVSTVLVTLTSVSLGVITQLVTKKIVDLNAERRMRAEVSAFNKEKREATLAKDKVKLDKLKKRELQVQQEQFKIQRARLKVTAITFVPLLAVYYLMASFLGGYGVIVAFTPIPIPYFAGATQNPAVFQVSLFWWYFLSSFAFSTMLTKLLHTTT